MREENITVVRPYSCVQARFLPLAQVNELLICLFTEHWIICRQNCIFLTQRWRPQNLFYNYKKCLIVKLIVPQIKKRALLDLQYFC